MIYFIYFVIFIIVIVLAIIFSRLLQRINDTQNFKKVIQQYHPLAIENPIEYVKNGKITLTGEAIINNIRSLDGDTEKKHSFIQKMNYKLTYVYGKNPLRNFIRLYLMSTVGMMGILYLAGLNIVIMTLVSLVFGLFGGILLTNRAYNKKIAHFLNNFVYAMDIIARGVRSGLSINLCFKQVVQDLDIVVGEQFLAVLDDYRLGMPTDQVMDRFMKRFPLKEVSFFCLSIITQAKTGGNLAEIVTSLAKILRNRKTLLLKIRTLSSEAKTSAMVMGGIPIAVMGLLYLIAPDYVGVLTNTDNGKLVLLGCGIWMSIGGLIMNTMINFYK